MPDAEAATLIATRGALSGAEPDLPDRRRDEGKPRHRRL